MKNYNVPINIFVKDNFINLGDNLRACRFEKKILLSKVADDTKIPLTILEKLELGDFNQEDTINISLIFQLMLYFKKRLVFTLPEFEEDDYA